MALRNVLSSLCALALVATSIAQFTAISTEPKFIEILSQAKLQYPTSDVSATSNELLNGFAAQHFHLTDDLYMQFQVAGSSRRSELRQMEKSGAQSEWACNDGTPHVARAVIAIPIQPKGIEEVTIMQVHGGVAPAVRISWVSSITINGVTSKDVVIATVRNGVEADSETIKTILQQHNTSRTTFQVTVKDGKVSITVNGSSKVDKASLSAFSKHTCYFKSGAYNNHPSDQKATARIKIKELEW